MEHQIDAVEYEGGTQDERDDSVVEIIPSEPSPRVPASGQQATVHQNLDEGIGKGSQLASCSGNNGSQENSSGVGGEWNRSEIDGLFCPICMEAWTNIGDHQVSCLPCGHIYGLSCIKKWIQEGSKKCPQCNKKCTLKNVRVLYASRICVVDQELQKKVRSLEAQCCSLEKMVMKFTGHHECLSNGINVNVHNADHNKEEVQWQKREVELRMKVNQLTERTKYLEGLLEDKQSKSPESVIESWGYHRQMVPGHNLDSKFGGRGGSSSFTLQREFQVDGARYFDVDASGQILIIARRLCGMGGTHVLTKISLIAPHETENIQLPASTKAVRDLHVSPHSRVVLVASLGKKLSALSMESNNTILSYDLPAPAWSCSWDINCAHYIYTGLQNGMLLVFDMRQTRGPVESINGLACNPIHTVQSVSPDSSLPSGGRTVLSASSIGLCEWNFGGLEERVSFALGVTVSLLTGSMTNQQPPSENRLEISKNDGSLAITCQMPGMQMFERETCTSCLLSFLLRPVLVPGTENHGVCISFACSRDDDVVASFRPKVEMSGELAVSQPFSTPSSSNMGRGVHGVHVLYKRMGSRQYQKLGCTHANVDDVRLPKSAIISRRNHNPLFAFGEEITSELVLHDLTKLAVVQRLKSQKQTIRDVRFTSVGNSGLLGCLSEDILQLFHSS